MHNTQLKRMLIFAVLVSLLLTACSSSEEKARAIYNSAVTKNKASHPAEYEQDLRSITSQYGSTAVATEAAKELAAIEKDRIDAEKVAVITLRTIHTASVTYLITSQGKYPRSLFDLAKENLMPAGSFRNQWYENIMTTAPDLRSFIVTATPERKDWNYFFISSEDGKVRFERGKPATKDSSEYHEQ